MATSLAACAAEAPAPSGEGLSVEEIIGGFPINSAKLNAVGALGRRTADGSFDPFCTGTLISPTMVLTAKHCVRFIKEPADFAFLIGPNAFAPLRAIPARGQAVEPTLTGGILELGSDVGILHLAQPVTDIAPLPTAALTPDRIGERFVAIGYGVQSNATGVFGTRFGGSMTLKATEGSFYAAIFGTFENFVEKGAPRYAPDFDPNTPEGLASLREVFEVNRLFDGIEGWFGSGPGDAQSCFGDSGGPMTKLVGTGDAARTTVFGVASFGLSLAPLTCEIDGGAYASMNPVSLDFIDYEAHCPLIPRAGTCDGLNVAVRCADPDEGGGRRELRTDCSELGLVCGNDAAGSLGCIEFEELCTHDKCETGAALNARCGTCETAICEVDSFCCGRSWDDICVDEVRTVCGSNECGLPPLPPPPPDLCPHDVCTAGAALDPACGHCEVAICEDDPFCCTTEWDDFCVSGVNGICHPDTCPAPSSN